MTRLTVPRRNVINLSLYVLSVAVMTLVAGPASAVDEQAEATRHARCAAYYFNATQAKGMGEYERLYRAGEAAFNRASRVLGRERTDRLIGDASLEMKQLIAGDWRRFALIEARYEEQCQRLAAAKLPDDGALAR